MKSKLIKTIIACLIIGAVSVGGYYGYNKFLKAKPVAAAAQYYTVNARKMNMQVSIQGTGAAYAANTKDVVPNNNGTLKDLNVKVGDTVTAGTKLFTSDSDDIRKTVNTAQNNLNKQNLTLSTDQSALSTDQSADKVDNNKIAMDNNKIAMDNLNITDAQNQLNSANLQLNKMAVTAPIGGVITAVNNSNGDSVQPGKAVLSIVDMSSLKIKVSVDELDIDKVKQGQKAEVKFDAIKDKTYDGTVETIAQTGTTSNNVTTYDVVVDITDPTGIKLGMNANVNILVDSKDNALAIPSEALIDINGNKFVMIPNSDSSTTSTTGSNASDNTAQGNRQQNAQSGSVSNGQSSQNGQQRQNRTGQGNSSGQYSRSGNAAGYGGGTFSGNIKRVPVKTGLENENYVEITEGLNEGDKVLVQLPQTSSTTNNNNRNGFGGMGGFGGGNFGGGNFGGGARNQSSSRTSGGSNARGN